MPLNFVPREKLRNRSRDNRILSRSPEAAIIDGWVAWIILFGRVKNEMYYGRNLASTTHEEFICILDRYIRWYNEKRIKVSLGGMIPVKYRQHLRITT